MSSISDRRVGLRHGAAQVTDHKGRCVECNSEAIFVTHCGAEIAVIKAQDLARARLNHLAKVADKLENLANAVHGYAYSGNWEPALKIAREAREILNQKSASDTSQP